MPLECKGPNGQLTGHALRTMTAGHKESVPFLKGRLRSAPKADKPRAPVGGNPAGLGRLLRSRNRNTPAGASQETARPR